MFSAAHLTYDPVSYETNLSDVGAVSLLTSHVAIDGNKHTTSGGNIGQLGDKTEDSTVSVYAAKRIVYKSTASSTIDKVTVYVAKPLDSEKIKDDGDAKLSREVEVTVKRLYVGRRLRSEKSDETGRIDYYYDTSGDIMEEPCVLELILNPGYSDEGNTASGQDLIASHVTNGTIMEFNCTGVGGSVLYVKTNSTILNITDVEIHGSPGADVFLIQPRPSSPLSNEVYHHIILKDGLTNTVVVLQENSQYLEDRSFLAVYNLTFTLTRESEVHSLFTVFLSPNSGVLIEGCVDQEFRSFNMPPGVCDGTKVEGKWNTWAIDLDRPHLVVHCDGNKVLVMDLSGECNILSLLSHDTNDMLIELTMLEEAGFSSLDINHYPEEETESSLSCKGSEEKIVSKCAEYHLYDEKGVLKSETKFIRSSIMEEFNNSLSFHILMKTIEEQARKKKEEDWMADHYQAYLETEFEKVRDTPEMKKLLEVEKAEIILRVKREVTDRQYQETNRHFEEASIFYKKMAAILQEAMTMVASSNQKSQSKQMDQENTAESIIRTGTVEKCYPENLLEIIGDVMDQIYAKIGSKKSTESQDTEEGNHATMAPIRIEIVAHEPVYKEVALHFIHYQEHLQMPREKDTIPRGWGFELIE